MSMNDCNEQGNHQQNDQDSLRQEPFEGFLKDWAAAKESKDSNAPFCVLATVTKDGFPRSRIVGLREVDGDIGTILLFVNDASPKFRELQATNKYELLTFWTHPDMLQYRIRGTKWTRLTTKKMEELWAKKPKTSQLLDYYYTQCQPQSSSLNNNESDAVSGRVDFVKTMKKLQLEFAEKDVPFQSIATGLVLEPNEIEEWRGSETDRLHERYLYKRLGNSLSWQRESLVP